VAGGKIPGPLAGALLLQAIGLPLDYLKTKDLGMFALATQLFTIFKEVKVPNQETYETL